RRGAPAGARTSMLVQSVGLSMIKIPLGIAVPPPSGSDGSLAGGLAAIPAAGFRLAASLCIAASLRIAAGLRLAGGIPRGIPGGASIGPIFPGGLIGGRPQDRKSVV